MSNQVTEELINNGCPCSPGPCPHFGKMLVGRVYELAKMDNEMGRRYRRRWLAAKDSKPLTDDGRKKNIPCAFQGPDVTGPNGRAQTQGCGTCGNNTRLKVFACQHAERKNEAVTWADCLSCPYYSVAGVKNQTTPAEEPGSNGGTKHATKHAPEVEVSPEPAPTQDKTTLVLLNRFSPGDILCMTAAIHSIHACYPNRFEIHVASGTPSIFEGNPDVKGRYLLSNSGITDLAGKNVTFPGENVTIINIEYPLINQSNDRAVHMMDSFVDFIKNELKLPNLQLMTNRPWIHLTLEERSWLPQMHERAYLGREQKYWVLNAGVKSDCTAKQYPFYQEVVDRLQGRVFFVQIGESNANHYHKPLRGVYDMIGKTDTRQLIRLIHHAEGVVSGISFPMHLAAALEKPAVILAGGREPKSWNSYPKQTYLDTVGQLTCCAHGGCWKGKLAPHPDTPPIIKDNIGICTQPAPTTVPAGRCQALIHPDRVVEAVEAYYRGGVLSY